MTPTGILVAGIIDSLVKVLLALLEGQTPEQRAVLWDRHIKITEPWYRLLVKVENLGHEPATTEAAK